MVLAAVTVELARVIVLLHDVEDYESVPTYSMLAPEPEPDRTGVQGEGRAERVAKASFI